MVIDLKIKEAIEEAIAESGQSKTLARLLVAWFNAIASGNEHIHDKQSADRHLELIYEETKTDGKRNDPEKEM